MANRSHRPGSSPADEYRRTKRKRLRASLCGAASIQEPTVGLEPTTCGLQNRCSAIELRRRTCTRTTRIPATRGTRSIGAARRTCQGKPHARDTRVLVLARRETASRDGVVDEV